MKEKNEWVQLGEFEGDLKSANLNAFMTAADWAGLEAVEIPEGFPFTDAESIKAYRMAVAGVRGPLGRLPVVVINSAQAGVGKSRLARLIFEKRFGGLHMDAITVYRNSPCGSDELMRAIPRALGCGHLWIDEPGPSLLRSMSLVALASASTWTYRPLRARAYVDEVIPENFQIIITGINLVLSAELARRSIIINLG